MGKYDYNAKMVYREDLNKDLSIFRFAWDDQDVPPFKPGQYAEIALPPSPEELARDPKQRVIRRPYSIASAPGDENGIELLIVKVDDGTLTEPLWAVKPGDPVWMNTRVKGTFTLEEVVDGVEGKNLVMVSTGTGIAPFMSMLREQRDDPPWRKFVMINGVRYCHDLAYWDELEDLAKEAAWFRYVPCVSREEWGGGVNGRVNKVFQEEGFYEKLIGEPLTPENTHVFLCGNPAMIDDLSEWLGDRGFTMHKRKEPGNVHFERYW